MSQPWLTREEPQKEMEPAGEFGQPSHSIRYEPEVHLFSTREMLVNVGVLWQFLHNLDPEKTP